MGPLEEQAKLFVTVFSLQLSASFLIESQGVQFLSHRREGCRLSLDCLELHDLELWLVERYAMYVRQISIAITRYL